MGSGVPGSSGVPKLLESDVDSSSDFPNLNVPCVGVGSSSSELGGLNVLGRGFGFDVFSGCPSNCSCWSLLFSGEFTSSVFLVLPFDRRRKDVVQGSGCRAR